MSGERKYVYESSLDGGPLACPGEEKCLELIAEGGTCVKYRRPCGNAAWCLGDGFECDFRYADYD